MTGWQFVALLATLVNSVAILRWQQASERRMDIHWERLDLHSKCLGSIEQMMAYMNEHMSKKDDA